MHLVLNRSKYPFNLYYFNAVVFTRTDERAVHLIPKRPKSLHKGQVVRVTFPCNLSCGIDVLPVEIICCVYYHLLARQSLYVVESRRHFHFLQHEKCYARRWCCMCCNLNMQCKNVSRRVARKCCPYYFTLVSIFVEDISLIQALNILRSALIISSSSPTGRPWSPV